VEINPEYSLEGLMLKLQYFGHLMQRADLLGKTLMLISTRIDQFDLLAVQGTLESSPPPQLKNISSLALSLLYDPTLTAIPLI